MSPERTSPATSLPVRADRAPRADHAAASDTFATLLGAHADRAERAPERRERQGADDCSPHDRRPVERSADRRRPAAAQPSAPADPSEPPASADDAAAAAAMLALGVPTPPVTPAPTEPTLGLASAQPTTGEAQSTVEALPTIAEQAAATPPQAATTGDQPKPASPPASPVAAVPTGSDAATPAVPLDAQADGAPVPATAGDKDADHAAELPHLPSTPAPRGDAKSQDGPTVPAAGLPATPTAGGEASAHQGDGRPAQHEHGQAATQAAQPATPAPTTRTDFVPTAAPAPGAPSASRGAATLSHAPRAVGQLIHLASQKGIQAARLNLRPVELGGIEIRLQSTAAGVAAQVVADSPHAARLLQQASDDLRRSLASQNVELLSLDVSTSGDERRDAGAAGDLFGAFGDSATRGQAGGRPQRDAATPDDLPTPTEGTVLELPDGVLVDVLA